eukprot:gnl/TRDRNA2_/TRDRNA2_172224_c0_seq4.p1 gnl/TRDRNA2_/TRDRNA2_172224_c0~~gnl/TRDRNA2_/TRDRNA2_172224_c0_seq4.p1  ORF type:complete len:449 (-),score=65.37 gnl/TRDRNA2_/TRDRNA2_172224_c0_seq4:130-1476(-)
MNSSLGHKSTASAAKGHESAAGRSTASRSTSANGHESAASRSTTGSYLSHTDNSGNSGNSGNLPELSSSGSRSRFGGSGGSSGSRDGGSGGSSGSWERGRSASRNASWDGSWSSGSGDLVDEPATLYRHVAATRIAHWTTGDSDEFDGEGSGRHGNVRQLLKTMVKISGVDTAEPDASDDPTSLRQAVFGHKRTLCSRATRTKNPYGKLSKLALRRTDGLVPPGGRRSWSCPAVIRRRWQPREGKGHKAKDKAIREVESADSQEAASSGSNPGDNGDAEERALKAEEAEEADDETTAPRWRDREEPAQERPGHRGVSPEACTEVWAEDGQKHSQAEPQADATGAATESAQEGTTQSQAQPLESAQEPAQEDRKCSQTDPQPDPTDATVESAQESTNHSEADQQAALNDSDPFRGRLRLIRAGWQGVFSIQANFRPVEVKNSQSFDTVQ